MTLPVDETDFIDRDLPANPRPVARMESAATRPPTREELETKVADAQHRIAELRRMQEGLERERAALEEARRRRAEFENGRREMLDHLTRGVGLLEKAEFEARRDTEQMGKTLADFREALAGISAIDEKTWTQENWNNELTRALTTLENARMEWNSALLKWTILNGLGESADASIEAGTGRGKRTLSLTDCGFGELCRIGLGLTWPVLLAALAGLTAVLILLSRK